MPGITIAIDPEALEPLIRRIVAETIAAMGVERAADRRPAGQFDAKAQRLLWTPPEAADAMGISERTLWSITAPRGDLPAVPCGKRAVRYDPRDVQSWIDRHKTRAGANPAAEQANGRRSRNGAKTGRPGNGSPA